MKSSSVVVAKASSLSRRLRRLSSSTAVFGSQSLMSSIPLIPGKQPARSNEALRPPTSKPMVGAANALPSPAPARRGFGSGGGARGARGHGWWVNYRAGKGGRHLQGTYSHLDEPEEMAAWNDAVFGLGSTKAYLDVRVEALAVTDDDESGEEPAEGSKASTTAGSGSSGDNASIHRLTLELATQALPLATENVLKLLQGGGESLGYHASTLHRIEKGVGILGGLVADNPNHQVLNPHAPMTQRKMGTCHPDLRMDTSPTAMDVSEEHLVLNHLPGVLTMLQPRIGEIDSRFLVLSHPAPHLDGVSVAVGRLATPESLDAVRNWESSLITSHGVPTNVTLRIVGCGVLPPDETTTESAAEPEATQAAEVPKKAAVQ